MATKTSLLGLTKPAYTEAADIAVLNNNFDLIDRAVGNGKYVRNELDNSDFTPGRLINQRGTTNYTQSGTYFVDRWITDIANNGATVIVGNGGITFQPQNGNYAGICQKLERYEQMKGKTYTFAVCVNDVWECTVFQLGNHGSGSLFANGLSFFSVEYAPVLLRSDSVLMITVQRVALYEGAYTAETLPAYVYKGYVAELTECQRYYQTAYRIYGANAGSVARESIVLRPAMRVAPTVSVVHSWEGNAESGHSVLTAAADYVDMSYAGWGNVRFGFSADL